MSSVPTRDQESFAFSIQAAQKFSGIGRTKLYDLLKNKKLIARKCGRKTLILKHELQRFLETLPVASSDTNVNGSPTPEPHHSPLAPADHGA